MDDRSRMIRTAAATLLFAWIVGMIAMATGRGVIHVLLALTIVAVVFEAVRLMRG